MMGGGDRGSPHFHILKDCYCDVQFFLLPAITNVKGGLFCVRGGKHILLFWPFDRQIHFRRASPAAACRADSRYSCSFSVSPVVLL